ncbi:methyl-accepting chemotaxis protein [Paenibacillus sp. M1]|uniref:Methyl-accepting chemotaxis protein n=1 Tax=Paenibacillus haidiansis TaxID=1574488 RepID=A0ABU7VZ66_9BACL
MSWFRNFKVSVKLSIAFIVMTLLIVIMGLFGLSNLNKTNDNLSAMYDNNLMPIRYLGDVSEAYQKIRVNIREIYYMAETREQKEAINQSIQASAQEIEDQINQYRNTQLTPTEEELLGTFATDWENYYQLVNQGVELAYANKSEEFGALVQGGFQAAGDKVAETISQLIERNSQLANDLDLETDRAYAFSRNVTVGLIVLAALIGLVLGTLISRSISVPLNKVVNLVKKVADGDLTETTDLDSKDEVGMLANSTNEMVLSLRKTVSSAVSTAEGVSAAAQQISASTEEIASGSAAQANAAQTINELFQELTAATHAVARIAEQASDISGDTMDIAEQGGKVVRSSIEGMNQVNLQVARLEDDSNRIGEIIEVIDDIAEQTNLLALNAAIEAARAGDQGRGFAVVADEVRKLAERSGEATKQITGIIKGMQENTRQSAKATREGVVLTEQTGEAFDLIIAKVNESAGKVTEIAAASQQQAAQSTEVLSAVENISAVTEESAASCEETASAAQSLAGLAEELNHTVSVFKVKL